MTGKNAVIDPSHDNQATFRVGENVKIECKEKIEDKLVTRELTCNTDGKFTGDSLVCCANAGNIMYTLNHLKQPMCRCTTSNE